jgi:predicted dehydrogenase
VKSVQSVVGSNNSASLPTNLMKNSKPRIGFIGTGKMGQAAHLRNYASLPTECEVVALAELRPELGARVAARFGIPRIYSNIEEMVAKENLDGLVASQQFTRHGVIVPELLRAGLPVFIEKPLASSVPVAEALVAADKAAGGKLMVGYHKRSDVATIRAKAEIDRLLQSGEIGKLRYLRLTMPPGDFIAGGFDELILGENFATPLETDPVEPGLDAATGQLFINFVNFSIHQLNLIRHLMGESYDVVYADPTKVLLIGRSTSGLPITLEMAPYGTTVDWHESAMATFDHGYVKLSLPAPLVLNQSGHVEIFKDNRKLGEGGTYRPELPHEHAMRTQAKNFLRFVRGEAPPPCGAAEALEDLRVARSWLKLFKGV